MLRSRARGSQGVKGSVGGEKCERRTSGPGVLDLLLL